MPEVTRPSVVVLALAAGPTLAAAIVAWRARRQPRHWSVVGCALLGTLAVGAQVWLASRTPGARAVLVAGIGGGWLWYLAWLRSSHQHRLAEQTLGVGGLFWSSATVTVTVVFSGTGWPVRWSLALAAVTGLGTVTASEADGWPRTTGPVVAVVGLPALVGWGFGSEILFVACLAWTVVGAIVWSLGRIGQQRGRRVRSN